MLFRTTDLLNSELPTDLFKDFERLTKGLNFGPGFDKAVEDVSTAFSNGLGGNANLDIVRSDDRCEMFIDLPGVDPATVELTVDKRTLTVSANRDFDVAEGDTHVHAGRRHGAFNRTYTLADDLNTDELTARSENGVLIVSIPVIAAPEPRKITITQ